MKNRPNNPVLQPEQAKLLRNCLVCGKQVEGYYSQHENGGTCSATCMKVQDLKPRYIGHTAEDFEKRFNL